ncbi:putative PEP-binding protein [Streptomyces radicis]|uniref:Pyruvate, phosphate dikinase n=1 Tax=Streptomyces radicis TaxID=1750517 RepID=A0A3A9VU05_9ACTN|nr:putative PEP-binding protein [Streptomyces radicis]RKN04259.1 pyruvate, phosphate dikinase [Streptomyces radicis]RKN14777.1 pyruvate, phosphate dikinase [Streptomyces radicis]
MSVEPVASLEIPAPRGVELALDREEAAVRAAVSSLDPSGRLGNGHDPLFLSLRPVDRPRLDLRYLGLTRESERWLSRVADPRFARSCRDGLAAAARRAGVEELPDDPVDQVVALINAFRHATPDGVVKLTVMPLGLGPESGSGIGFSCDPRTGEPGLHGSFRADSVGADLLALGGTDLAGTAATESWARRLTVLLSAAQARAGQPVRAEFVVERGRLWVLALTTTGFSGTARMRAVRALGDHGDLTARQALATVRPEDVRAALVASAEQVNLPRLAHGTGISPGIASGPAVFSAAEATAARERGDSPVLVLPESRPEDLPGLLAACAVVTARGGRTSHSAVVSRSLGRPCVSALTDATVDVPNRRIHLATGDWVGAGQQITVDGFAGVVHRGTPAAREPVPTDRDTAVTEVLGWLVGGADGLPRMGVRVNADTSEDAVRGRRSGATGVGLCRLEHIFLGERQRILERVLTSRGPAVAEALREVHQVLRAELTAMLRVMDGLPVTVRLLDPPRHEFLPDPVALLERAAAGAPPWSTADAERVAPALRLRETNPMLGVRGIRMSLLMPELAMAQIRALVESVAVLRRSGGDPRAELLLPMVSTTDEVRAARRMVHEVCEELLGPRERSAIPVGVMIETPRAALLAGELGARADFLSLGTNDLTALVWGLSRDDAESELLPAYLDRGVLRASPFERLDREGVGRLLARLVREARTTREDIPIGVCGEHAGDPEAIGFFADIGVDYVSCVPPSVPLARFAAARLAVGGVTTTEPTGHESADHEENPWA